MWLIRFLLVCLVPVLVLGQTPILLGDGKIFGKVSGKTRLPIIVIDTVVIIAGYGTLKLNKQIKVQTKNVVPSKKNSLYATITPILGDTTKTVYYYGYTINSAGDLLTVKSSGGTNDTGCVVIQIFMR